MHMMMFNSYEEIFAKRADAYHAAMKRSPKARAREFELVVERLQLADGMVICDAPAGGGYLRPYIQNNNIRYIALDCTDDFLDHCPTDGKNERHMGSLTTIPLPDNSVDRVVNLAGIHHEADKLLAFREFHRILKPGGLFILADVEQGTPPDAFLNTFVDQNNSMRHHGDFLNHTSRDTLLKAGFEITRDDQIPFPWSFDSEPEMGAFCKSLFGMDKISENDVVVGIDRYLGRCDGPGNTNMAWALSYIVSSRPR